MIKGYISLMKINLRKINFRKSTLRYLTIFVGLFIVANGIVFTINANLGVNPWDVLHIGIAYQTGLSIGRVIQAIGLLLVTVSYFFGVKIYVGTVLNMISLGLFVDLTINCGYIPVSVVSWQQILLYIMGVFLFGLGTAIYISANLGAGPRDSLMFALTNATSMRVGNIRTILEITVATIGFFLGGPLGIGTVIFALTIGAFMELGFSIISRIKITAAFKRLWEGSARHIRGL